MPTNKRDKREKESKQDSISELAMLCSLLDLEFGITADMPIEEIESGLREMGLDPNAPPPAGVRHLFLGGNDEPLALSAAAGLAAGERQS